MVIVYNIYIEIYIIYTVKRFLRWFNSLSTVRTLNMWEFIYIFWFKINMFFIFRVSHLAQKWLNELQIIPSLFNTEMNDRWSIKFLVFLFLALQLNYQNEFLETEWVVNITFILLTTNKHLKKNPKKAHYWLNKISSYFTFILKICINYSKKKICIYKYIMPI